MATLARPDMLGALLSHLNGLSEVTEMVSSAAGSKTKSTQPRISAAMNKDWLMPTSAVRLRRTGGPIVGMDYSMALWSSRVDVLCYGSTVLNASKLIDVVLPALCVLQGNAAGFIEGTCLIGSIEPEADVYADVEPETTYPFAWAPLLVRWVGVPVAVSA